MLDGEPDAQNRRSNRCLCNGELVFQLFTTTHCINCEETNTSLLNDCGRRVFFMEIAFIMDRYLTLECPSPLPHSLVRVVIKVW